MKRSSPYTPIHGWMHVISCTSFIVTSCCSDSISRKALQGGEILLNLQFQRHNWMRKRKSLKRSAVVQPWIWSIKECTTTQEAGETTIDGLEWVCQCWRNMLEQSQGAGQQVGARQGWAKAERFCWSKEWWLDSKLTWFKATNVPHATHDNCHFVFIIRIGGFVAEDPLQICLYLMGCQLKVDMMNPCVS